MHRYVWQCECIKYLYNVIMVLYGTEWQGRLDRDVFHEPVLFRMSCFILKEPVISKELFIVSRACYAKKFFLLKKSCFTPEELFYFERTVLFLKSCFIIPLQQVIPKGLFYSNNVLLCVMLSYPNHTLHSQHFFQLQWLRTQLFRDQQWQGSP